MKKLSTLHYHNITYLYTFMETLTITMLENNVAKIEYVLLSDPLQNFEVELPATLVEKKLERLGIDRWKRRYQPELIVCDGESWEVKMVFADGSKKVCRGENEYPDCWEDFKDIISWARKLNEMPIL